jgi:hypothetical protein
LWFCLGESGFVEIRPDGGFLRFTVFPGLWLDPRGLFSPSTKTLTSALRKGLGSPGLGSPEHAGFVAELAECRKKLKAARKPRRKSK